MRKLRLHLPALALLIFVASCSQDQIVHREAAVKLDKDSVIHQLGSHRFFISEAYRFVGSDSADLMQIDPKFDIYRKEVYLAFRTSGSVLYWFGTEIDERAQQGASYTFSMNIRIERPIGLRVHWDDEKGTAVVESEPNSPLPMIVLGKKAYLETSTYKIYPTLEEARNASVRGSATFIYEDDDAKLGKVTYKIKLKPMYQYYRAPDQQNHAKFAVF
ncbi:hypothetical protein [Dyadobacter crusticola]|uniref:hypothetical protein n=1 Tax=Dyadobacter crusticola TaxID=292407 RepID=UPI0004E13AB6|nr:hypothetical protein [Dyadobacter crusticola]